MKTADIQVGGEYGYWNNYGNFRHDYERLLKVEVLELRAEREYSDPASWRPRTKTRNDGIRVRIPAGKGHVEHERVVRPKDVIATWSEVEKHIAESKRWREESERQRAETQAAWAAERDAVRELAEKRGLTVEEPKYSRFVMTIMYGDEIVAEVDNAGRMTMTLAGFQRLSERLSGEIEEE